MPPPSRASNRLGPGRAILSAIDTGSLRIVVASGGTVYSTGIRHQRHRSSSLPLPRRTDATAPSLHGLRPARHPPPRRERADRAHGRPVPQPRQRGRLLDLRWVPSPLHGHDGRRPARPPEAEWPPGTRPRVHVPHGLRGARAPGPPPRGGTARYGAGLAGRDGAGLFAHHRVPVARTELRPAGLDSRAAAARVVRRVAPGAPAEALPRAAHGAGGPD